MHPLFIFERVYFNYTKTTMKNKPLLILGVGVLLFIAVVSYRAYPAENIGKTQYSAAALTALQNEYDFGTINMKDGTVSRLFEVKNDGAEPVVVTNVYTSCMCTSAFVTDALGKKSGPFGMPGHGGASARANITIGVGEIARVEAAFDPAAHGPSGVGLAERSIYLETNSKALPTVELKFRAIVVR